MTVNQATLMLKIARELRDPAYKTFSQADLRDFIADGLAEIGDTAPELFQENITPIANTAEYRLRSGSFSAAVREIGLTLVELWTNATPSLPVLEFVAASSAPIKNSQAGWRVWNGTLALTQSQVSVISPTAHIIRVWGYSPFAIPAAGGGGADDIELPLSTALGSALAVYARKEGMERLNVSRDLYQQWQTQSNNTDVSPAALMNALTLARDEWRRLSRKLVVLRDSQ